MITTLIVVGAFVMALVLFARFKPGKTDKNLTFDQDEQLRYECDGLKIIRLSQLGRGVQWPGSKVQITNKRVIFSQKALMSDSYAIHEIAVNRNNPPESLKNANSWGQVSIYKYNKDDFSVITQDNKRIIIFRNHFAPNLDRMEIYGVSSVEEFMQALE